VRDVDWGWESGSGGGGGGVDGGGDVMKEEVVRGVELEGDERDEEEEEEGESFSKVEESGSLL